ncbi:NAD-dependent epimerase/dehydratase family protein [Acidovorax sp. NCPPB 4044]|uniref:NAD-dependent epimerase/dehydratase family protein n=1 Tax=Acidovorax sp. NCPPB 4044 TaxID=2940490 RepID=UPI00230293A8|nr:NAD-dependent epimerase/dehydratase family protein [Acidovorax sp. NCPPB 4044]MDA8519453.1 NAD-dependent epimerase/dehydratase family protein [Acidovorax sp. NCPPB 4044]
MRILLTGSTGMVGRNFMEHPAAQDFEILAPSHQSLDLQDYLQVERFMAQNRPDVVVHAAGVVGGIQANMARPVAFLLGNLDMGRNVVMAARSAGVRRLVNLGSSCMFPRGLATPLREDMVLTGELEPTNEGYALAKIMVARLCDYISRQKEGFEYKTLIPCNLFGRHDKFSPDVSHLVPAILQKIHAAKRDGAPSVEIWGDGNARREFMYAGDLADCLVEAIRRFDSLPSVMNVGIGADHTINDYYRIGAEIVGYTGTFHHDLTKPVGMMRKLVDTSVARGWGWQASTPLEEGMRKAYDYYLGLSSQTPSQAAGRV